MYKLRVALGDITQFPMDVIVNAANQRLLGGAGVDGAIHKAGGPKIMLECDQIRAQQGGCPTGQAVITTAGNLPASYVIHTVGPIYNGCGNREAGLLANCYFNSLVLADLHGVKRISFPNISTGVYAYPKAQAAQIAINSVHHYFDNGDSKVSEVNFVCFDSENHDFYNQMINKA